MPIYELTDTEIQALPETTFHAQGLHERRDLQRILQDNFEVIDADVMILAEEFGSWDDARRRIDLLGVDREARLVVVELKRTEDGGHMELQALRYAAMVSRMTFEQAVEAHARWLEAKGRDADAERELLDFLGWDEPDEDAFGQDVRILLVSADFSKELTTAVLWLNERDLDVRCVRLRPYAHGTQVLLDVQQVIPLPEARDYVVQVREKERRERRARESSRDLTRYDVAVDGDVSERLAKRHAIHRIVRALCAKGVSPEEVSEVVAWRGNLWRCADGTLDAEAFSRRLEREARAGGPAWNPTRWHAGDDALIHHDGRTWALSNQWGESTGRAIQLVLERWPDRGVSAQPVSRS